jgi:hypothetical protein
MAGCFCFTNPSGFLFGPSQKGTICSSDFLGHRMIQEGLKMDDHKVKAIVD